jgi:hypothetical protein
MCYNNSFASVERCKFLHDKTLNPRTLFKSTNKKYKFDCDKCNNEFETQLSDITKCIWCPHCVNKTEEKLYNELSKHYDVYVDYDNAMFYLYPLKVKHIKPNYKGGFNLLMDYWDIIPEEERIELNEKLKKLNL